MKSKEELIEIIAAPIHEGNSCTSWQQALKSAEEALEALCRALPEESDKWHAVDIYYELKQYGENN